jgi:hypothetical protein
MQRFSAIAFGLAMVAAFLLLAGGVKLTRSPQSRTRGLLMIVAAAVIIMNVMIWTV